ncbi:MAG: hypothetical protein V3S14_12390, partial [Anaerolineae bacterium]
MGISIKQLLAAPVFEDEDTARVVNLLNVISLVLLVMAIVGVVLASAQGRMMSSFAGIFVGLLSLVVQYLMRHERVQMASLVQSSALWLAVTYLAVSGGGVRAAAFGSYILVVIIAGLLLGSNAGITAAGLSVVTGLGMVYAESRGILSYAEDTLSGALLT